MAEKKTKKAPVEKQKKNEMKIAGLPLGKQNYLYLIIGLILIAIGFILMIGGGSDDPNVFNEKIFNTQRLTIAPILIILGLIVEIVAIMKKSDKKTGE